MGILGRGGRGGENTRTVAALVNGPSPQAVALASSMAIATNTSSPMARGGGPEPGGSTFAGLPGVGVHRFTGWVYPPTGDPSVRAVTPVAIPVDVKYGFGGGPSQPPAYPSTGHQADFGALAAMDLGKLNHVGMG
jgi:hypothetical protein